MLVEQSVVIGSVVAIVIIIVIVIVIVTFFFLFLLFSSSSSSIAYSCRHRRHVIVVYLNMVSGVEAKQTIMNMHRQCISLMSEVSSCTQNCLQGLKRQTTQSCKCICGECPACLKYRCVPKIGYRSRSNKNNCENA